MPDTQQVEVYNPQGKLGTIPPAQLEKAKAAGYKPKSDFVEAVHPKTGQTGIIPKEQWGKAETQGYVMSPREQQRVKAKTGPSIQQGAPAGKPMSVDEMANTPYFNQMEKSNVDAAQFGADMLGGGTLLKKLFSPTTITKAGPLVPGGRAATGRMLPWIRSQVTAKGPSLAGQGVGKVVTGAKDAASWLRTHKTEGLVIEMLARQMGIDPIQLVQKVLKYGKQFVP